MYEGDFPGEAPQKTQIVVWGDVEGVEVPLATVKGADGSSIEGVLEAPPEAILIFKKQQFEKGAIKVICMRGKSELGD